MMLRSRIFIVPAVVCGLLAQPLLCQTATAQTQMTAPATAAQSIAQSTPQGVPQTAPQTAVSTPPRPAAQEQLAVDYSMPDAAGMERVEISPFKRGMFAGDYSLHAQAYQALTQRRFGDAQRLFDQILAMTPDDASAQFGKAIALQRSGNPTGAADLYQQVLNNTALDARTRSYAFVNLAFLMPQRVSSPQAFDTALQNGVESAFVETVRGYYALHRGDAITAVRSFRTVHAQNPGHPIFQYNLALAYDTLARMPQQSGRTDLLRRAWQEAVTYYDKVLNNPDRRDFFTDAQLRQCTTRKAFLAQELAALGGQTSAIPVAAPEAVAAPSASEAQ
jgi:tetratricopeptide (TPR) repeat protein